MQHYILRCKHCHKTYTYCTHGNDDGCSMDYCGECQTAIDNALGKIKVKFEPKFVEIKPSFGLDDLLTGIKKRETKDRPLGRAEFPMVACLNLPDCDYDKVEEYIHRGKTFRIAWDEGKEDERHYFLQMEYDIEKGEVTRNVWKTDHKDSYRHGNSMKYFNKQMCKAMDAILDTPKFDPPSGKMFFMDFPFEWEIKVPKTAKRKKAEHKLREYTINWDGYTLKSMVERGRNTIDGPLTAIPPEGYNGDDVCEALEYEVSIARYDDENVERITDIKVK